jgi:hypothetical protein
MSRQETPKVWQWILKKTRFGDGSSRKCGLAMNRREKSGLAMNHQANTVWQAVGTPQTHIARSTAKFN